MASIKPLDAELVRQVSRSHKAVVTYENHSTIGGLGSAVAEVIARSGTAAKFAMIGVNDCFAEGGSKDFLFKTYGLDTREALRVARQLLS
jgi:transketolase